MAPFNLFIILFIKYFIILSSNVSGIFNNSECLNEVSCSNGGGSFTPFFPDSSGNGRYYSIGLIRIYAEQYGKGSPVILIHGNGGSISSFSGLIPLLAANHRVIAVDTRGQGKSGYDSTRYSYHLFAEDFNKLLNALNVDSAIVIGWSDGGIVGLIMAMNYPVKVKKLVAMGANVFSDSSVFTHTGFADMVSEAAKLKNDTTPEGINHFRLTQLMIDEPHIKLAELSAIKCPVMVMAGEFDVISPLHTQLIHQSIPGSVLKIVKGESHFLPVQNPGLFYSGFQKFIEE